MTIYSPPAGTVNSDRVSYTYLLTHIPTNTHYYGVRYARGCHPSDFWVSYTTSSVHVAALIKIYGKDSFKFQIRKTFTDSLAARKWEATVLKRIKAVSRPDFINRTDSDLQYFHDPKFKWYNNTKINTLSAASPGPQWVVGRLNQKPTTAGTKIFNNGIIQVACKGKPNGEEWQVGMLPKKAPMFKIRTCNICGFTGKGSGMTRYHFENCPGGHKAPAPGGQGKYQRLRVSCIVCRTETSTGAYKRYHGNKCKEN